MVAEAPCEACEVSGRVVCGQSSHWRRSVKQDKAINNAFDVLMNELQAHEMLAQQQEQDPKRRYAGRPHFDRAGQKKPKSRTPPRTAPPPKSSKPWPHRKIPTKPPPPTSLPDPPPNATDTSLKSLLRKHNTHIGRLLDVQALAESVHDWIKGQTFTGIHPATYEASGHVLSWFKSEIRLHNKIWYELEGLDSLWANRKDSEKQIYWYIKTMVDGTKDKLGEMHSWLKNFMMDFIVLGANFDEADEWQFFTSARKWCPEDQQVYMHKRSR